MTPEFIPFPKIPRLVRNCCLTEKIDGTNAVIHIQLVEPPLSPTIEHTWIGQNAWGEDVAIYAGSRTKWITPQNDNHGFARWVAENAPELLGLGFGTHRGEWWGSGIQRRYGLKEKRFSLFNVAAWHEWDRDPVETAKVWTGSEMVALKSEPAPKCCHVVPLLYRGPFSTEVVRAHLTMLEIEGSSAAPGFMDAEGVCVYHEASGTYFKQTIHDDQNPKSL